MKNDANGIKFCTNNISLGKVDTFDEIIEKYASAKGKVVKTAEADEAPSSGQPEAEAKLVNTPEKEEGKGGKADNSEAPSSGQPEAEAKLVNTPKVEAESDEDVKEASAETEECEDKKEEEEKEKECEEKEEKEEECEEKEASAGGFVKVSKLNSKTKDMLSAYYSSYYPSEFVEALLKDYSA